MSGPSELLHFPHHLSYSLGTYFSRSRDSFSNPPSNCIYKSFWLWCRSLPSLTFAATKTLTPTTQQRHGYPVFPPRTAPLSPFGSQFSSGYRTRCKRTRLQSRSARSLRPSCPERRHPVRGQICKRSTLGTFYARNYLAGREPAPAGMYILFLPVWTPLASRICRASLLLAPSLA